MLQIRYKSIPVLNDVPDYFWKRIEMTDGHWLWTGYMNRGGYGTACMNRAKYYAHRVFYTVFIGPIPEGLQIDHLCRVKNCVNPEHLEAVTIYENISRVSEEARARKEYCLQEHSQDANNHYLTSDGRRRCNQCRTEYMRRYRHSLKS